MTTAKSAEIRTQSASDFKPEDIQTNIFLRWNGAAYPIEQLDEYTFIAMSPALAEKCADADVSKIYDGEVRCVGENVAVQFRIRDINDDRIVCGFFDLPIASRERLVKMAESTLASETDELQTLSYDELALGNTSTETVGDTPLSALRNKTTGLLAGVDQSTMRNGIAVAAMAGTMLLIAGWLAIVGFSQSTITVSNSVMAGNYQPVNSPLEGKLLDLNVAIGDRVAAGQVIATILNPSIKHELGVAKAQISRAQRELEAYRRQATETRAMLDIARQTLRTKHKMAIAVKNRIKADLRGAQSKLKRLSRLRRNRRVRMGEYEEALALRDRWNSELVRQDSVIAGVVLAEKAAANDVIVRDERIINPMSEIRTKIEIALSFIKEMQTTRDLLSDKAKPTELIAPSSGTVFAIYRRPGEILKLAEEAIAISRDGDSWATGHVPSEVAAEIKPGQLVEIEIPSYGVITTGVVEGIGHRAVHGRGGYTADFRSSPFDVPIRVALTHTEKNIPSGLRLNMTIRVRDRVKELRNWVHSWVAYLTPESKPSNPIWYAGSAAVTIGLPVSKQVATHHQSSR